ncbi:MAG: homocysteine S-methyltransferase family protein [Acidobacteriota bacterium]|nr:homocysteine S-methyltransferase family protein [Acidobacteriota bacterium]
MNRNILDRLAAGPVLGDGGYIIELERRGYGTAGAFTPHFVLDHPEAIRQLHVEFLNAGAEVLQVMAFYGSRAKLATVGRDHQTMEINRKATRICREVAGDQALVAGDLCATWKWEEGSPSARNLVAAMFEEQIEAQEGVDFIIGETFWRFGEARLCLEVIKKHTSVPAMITVSFRGGGKTEDGYSPAECARILTDEGADIVGTNCMRDPERTYPIIEAMREATGVYLAAQPVAFACTDRIPWFTANPAFPDRLERTLLTRYELGEFAPRARDLGVDFIGGCCGCIGSHILEMARGLGKKERAEVWQPFPDSPMSETEFNWEHRHSDEPAVHA